MSSHRQMSLGRLAYTTIYRPFGQICTSLSEGGPFVQRRTRQGRCAMEQTAFTLPLLSAQTKGAPLTLYIMTGGRFWYQTVFCLWTFARQSHRALAPVIIDDGSLTPVQSDALLRLFPSTRILRREDNLSRLESLLPQKKFPVLHDRWHHYPHIRKIIDVHLGSSGWKLVLDSDLLFFRNPGFLLDWLASPSRPLHAVDCTESYGYSRSLMESLVGAPIPALVNVGLCGLRSDDIDWQQLESWCGAMIAREKTHYYLEQALVAMLAARQQPCAVAPAHDYLTLPPKKEALHPTAVMHHYVASAKRWYFQTAWRHAMELPAR